MSDFQRRHYETIARVLGVSQSLEEATTTLARIFQMDNAKFELNLFLHVVNKSRTDAEWNRSNQAKQSEADCKKGYRS
jgi:hypothetical protein